MTRKDNLTRVFICILLVACASTQEPAPQSTTHSQSTRSGQSGQSAHDAFTIVCVDAPRAVASEPDLAQRDFDYGRYISTHVTNQEVLRFVIGMMTNTPSEQRAAVLDQAAQSVGLADCRESLFSQ